MMENKMKEITTLIEKMPLKQLQSIICLECDGERLYIDGIEVAVHTEQIEGVVATIKLSQDHLYKILVGEENAISLFTMGEIEIEGDTSVAFKLKDIFG